MVNFQKTMRRSDKRIEDLPLIYSILKKAQVMRLGLCYGDMPYIVPLNFVFDENQGDNGVIYLHSSLEGLKIDIIRKNSNVCFEVEEALELVIAPTPCNWGMKYLSVVGYGKISFEDDTHAKIKALDLLMNKYAQSRGSANGVPDETPDKFKYNTSALDATCLLKIGIESLSGKKSGF